MTTILTSVRSTVHNICTMLTAIDAEIHMAFPDGGIPCVEDGETESYDSIGYTLELDAEMWDTTPYRLNEVLSALDYFWRVENNRMSSYMGEV